MSTTILRNLPSIDQLLRRGGLQPLISESSRDVVRDRLREVLDGLRQEVANDEPVAEFLADAATLGDEIERRLQERFARRQQRQVQRVINATGVVLHTNLGRAPLSQAALQAPGT